MQFEYAWKYVFTIESLVLLINQVLILIAFYIFSCSPVTKIKPQFAILASGFRSGSLAHANYYEETILWPSLHIFGDADEIIPPEMSESLTHVFEEPTIVRHPGGHYFAAKSKQKQLYVEFFRDRLQEHLEKIEFEKADEIATLESSIDLPNPSNLMTTTASDDSD